MKEGVTMINPAKGTLHDCLIGEKCGTITVSIYKETSSGSPIFYLQSSNEDVLPVSYVIEDILSLY